MAYSVRKELILSAPVPHGGLDYRRLRGEGINPGAILDFSVSTNPFDPCPEVFEAVGRAAFTRYPDSSSGDLRLALAGLNGISEDSILVTNGLAQAIFLTAFAFIDRGDAVLIASPSFGEYAAASRLAGAEVFSVSAEAGENFVFPLERLIKGVERRHPSLIWVCSPNNPTGNLPSKEQLAALLGACENEGALLVLDEAYVNFAPPGASSLHLLSPNLLLFRSMTKDYGLTGLRLGYVLGEPRGINILAALQPPWSVNACAQAAGLAAIRNGAYYEAQWRALRDLTAMLARGLEEAGFAPFSSAGNFLLFPVEDVESLKVFLWKDFILVRDCASFGLEGHVRVGVKGAEENERLLKSLRAFRREAN